LVIVLSVLFRLMASGYPFRRLWCFTPLSTIVAARFISKGNRSIQRKPPTGDWQTLSHKIVSITPRHERDSKSQL